MAKTILFISNMAGSPWGGSEELWTRTAFHLAKQGVSVAASVHGWPQPDRQIIELSQIGVDLRPRPIKPTPVTLVRRYMSSKTQLVFDVERSFGNMMPNLVLISNAYGVPPLDLAEMCVVREWPFAILTHSGLPSWWPSGDVAAKARRVLPQARRCFFVALANQTLAEKQLGIEFENAEIVRNPLIIQIDSAVPWPTGTMDEELRMACVGRLSSEKGQDILVEVLATPRWMQRNWRLTLYGNGPTRDVLGRLVKRLQLQDRVSFAGHVAVKKIWRDNHVLVMPSRCEGMPLTIVEAMFCGRPVVATNVGGIPEVVKDGLTGFLAVAPVVECFGDALERMWSQRSRLQEIGAIARESVRRTMPKDPVAEFAEKLVGLATLGG